ncbi:MULTISPECIES: phage holin family protein [Gardnerella]|uniref:Holin n=1 Tax=Gardnerella vaginalis TaxID=2702 RepID=A0AAP8LSD6_GARVA|nr:phage holin family protein [Gardnerella sp. 30-4]PKZ59960.1 holin [Gardnerella vaginalis]
MNAELIELSIVAVLVVLDYVSGFVKALATHTVSSTKMRSGLFHKFAYVLVLALALLLEHGQQYIHIGITIPIVAPVCGYITIMEILSVLENAQALNPELAGSGIFKIFVNSSDALRREVEAQTGKHAAVEADTELDGRGKKPEDTPTENK